MRVLHVATSDGMGGAGRVASDLMSFEREAGVDAVLAVASKRGTDPHVATIDEPRIQNAWYQSWRSLRDGSRTPLMRRALGAIADPRAALSYARGTEDFAFSSTRRLPEIFHPDLVHLHNLHGNYFDLTALPELSARQPVVLTMHDCWLMAGHCAQPLACERWKIGCGECPDLTIAPAVGRDATAFNWQRKAGIYRKSQLYVALPSRWLEPRIQHSMLAPAVRETRVIPHGVDLDVFRPGDRQQARASLGLPLEGYVLLTVANGGRANSYKDIETLERALNGLDVDRPVTAVILGEIAEPRLRGKVRVVGVPFGEGAERIASYYRACDIYVHATRAEVFGLSIIEALACGVPVVASAVGGVPEIVRSMRASIADGAEDRPTGWLVAPGDAVDLRMALTTLLSDSVLRESLGAAAARDARERFDVRLQAHRYIEWYEEILSRDR